MNLNLTSHVAVVTGGASGIGRAIAAGFRAEGCQVAIWDAASDVEDTARALDVLGVRVDVTDYPAVLEAVHRTVQQIGALDHLVHAAAIGSSKFGFPFTNLTPGDWPRVLEVNIMGMTNVAHAVAPTMVERQRGTLIFIGSVAGQIGSPTDPPYSASKAANINFAQCLAKDLAPHGIRVNTICPGMVETPLNRRVWQAWHDQQPPSGRKSYDAWAGEKVRAMVPLGRWQTPDDIADMALFLSSERADQVTGQTINVDGGFVMHW
jgi:NAD(P)-dependent dehydrogenase (short-subunit alcohol dehydrogenase family)